MSDFIIETERLIIDSLTLKDADFILGLTNSDGWLKNIGDRDIHTLNNARQYIENGPINSYKNNGFGLWCMRLNNAEKTQIGLCGLVLRPELELPDLGFAILPEYQNKGYTYEACKIILHMVKSKFGLKILLAITNTDNKPSNNLLKKLSFKPMGTMQKDGKEVIKYQIKL